MKSHRAKFVPARNPVTESGKLQIETLDESGNAISSIEISAADFVDPEETMAIEIFAYHVAEERRKIGYHEEFPLSDGEHNASRINIEMGHDFFEWSFRRRGDRERWEGLGDAAVAIRREQE